MKKELVYPARINKYLAYNNFCTRREADQLVAEKRVKINGRVAVLGDKVLEGDQVTVDKKNRRKKIPVYLAFNKPKGVITHSPQQEGEKEIADILKFDGKVFPVGRLDKDSSGLIILTNDGRITERMLSPDHYHEKEYVVTVDRSITPAFIRHMTDGVELEDGYITRESQVKKIDSLTFSIVLTEGKKHQIRRMCEKLGRVVKGLKRVRVMNIKLEKLARGEHRLIQGEKLQEFLRAVDLEGAEWI